MKEKIKKFAEELGFSLIAFTIPQTEKSDIEAYEKWLEEDYEGEMKYLRKTEPRKDFSKILENPKTIISLATNYFYEQKELKPEHGRIARYAYGRDYHKVIKKRLKKLETYIKELAAEEGKEPETRSYVDTGPILERAMARQAGLGFIGKNSCLITKEFGSWVFLSEIITTLELELDVTPSAARTLNTTYTFTTQHATQRSNPAPPFAICGSCRLCIDACPTKAIIAPGIIDARRCISYQTIENKTDKIPKEFAKAIAKTKRIFGCDICQEVCPHNSRAKESTDKDLRAPSIAGDQLSLKEILAIKEDSDYLEKFAGSPLMRTKRRGLQRNAEASQE